MSIYAIGDIQGCYTALQKLLQKIDFDPSKDKLWFTGDLVNRGSKSLEVLRFVKNLGEQQQTVLGNHDLHLLAVAETGLAMHAKDTLSDILKADDCEELLSWLRHQAVMVEDQALGFMMVHAGVAPQWDITLARQCARELEAIIQGNNYRQFLEEIRHRHPLLWRDDLQGWERYSFLFHAFMQIRFCDQLGQLNFDYKCNIGDQPAHLLPWFQHPQRKTQQQKIIFGHWAALQGVSNEKNCFALDTGCVWGRQLTAMRLSDQQRFSV